MAGSWRDATVAGLAAAAILYTYPVFLPFVAVPAVMRGPALECTWLRAGRFSLQAILQEHLRSCQACQALSDAWQRTETHLKGKIMVEAEAGFTARWQARLETDRRRAHRRQTWAMLAFCVGGAVLLLATMAAISWQRCGADWRTDI
jgi:ferric-dicitrate binding protein FerR (iron transport regulator)